MSKLFKYAFSDLYDISSGISSTKDQAGHGTPFASFRTVFNNIFLPDKLPDLMEVSEKEQKIYSIKKGDILITRTSETVDELAMSCVALKDYPQATYSGFVKRLRPKTEGIVYDRFMAFFLRSKYFRKVIECNTIMTLRASFNEDIFSFLDLYLPDYETQKRIGDLLYHMERKRENNAQINDNLANTEQAILVETVINNHTVPTALGDLVDFIDGDRGKNYPTFDEFTSTGYCLFLNASNVTSTGFNFDNCMFVSEEKDKLMNKGHLSPYDIVLTSRGTLGNVALYDKHIKYENVRINSGMLIIRPKTKRLSPYFIYALLKSSYMKAAIERFKSGSAQPQLPIKDLQKITFEIPESDTVLVALDRQFLAVEESISINNNEIGNLKELSNVLLAELSR